MRYQISGKQIDIGEALQARHRRAQLRQEALRRHLRRPRAPGLAAEGRNQRVRFHHRSVQEYLAACRLRRLCDLGMPTRKLLRLLFAELYGVDRWSYGADRSALILATLKLHPGWGLVARDPSGRRRAP